MINILKTLFINVQLLLGFIVEIQILSMKSYKILHLFNRLFIEFIDLGFTVYYRLLVTIFLIETLV